MNTAKAKGSQQAEGNERFVGAAALTSFSSHLLFWGVAAGVLGLDLGFKQWVFGALAPNEVRPLFSGVINLRRSLNDGAVFGSFTGHSSLFIIASLFALGFVVYLFSRSLRSQRSFHVALALILAGALGNLYDRAFVVADVVHFHPPTRHAHSFIGTIVSHPEDDQIHIGDWPEGTRVRSFPRDEVSVRQQGVVRDFIKFVPKFPGWVPKLGGRDVWPWVFNIADAALVVGVILLLINSRLDRNSTQP